MNIVTEAFIMLNKLLYLSDVLLLALTATLCCLPCLHFCCAFFCIRIVKSSNNVLLLL